MIQRFLAFFKSQPSATENKGDLIINRFISDWETQINANDLFYTIFKFGDLYPAQRDALYSYNNKENTTVKELKEPIDAITDNTRGTILKLLLSILEQQTNLNVIFLNINMDLTEVNVYSTKNAILSHKATQEDAVKKLNESIAKLPKGKELDNIIHLCDIIKQQTAFNVTYTYVLDKEDYTWRERDAIDNNLSSQKKSIAELKKLNNLEEKDEAKSVLSNNPG